MKINTVTCICCVFHVSCILYIHINLQLSKINNILSGLFSPTCIMTMINHKVERLDSEHPNTHSLSSYMLLSLLYSSIYSSFHPFQFCFHTFQRKLQTLVYFILKYFSMHIINQIQYLFTVLFLFLRQNLHTMTCTNLKDIF